MKHSQVGRYILRAFIWIVWFGNVKIHFCLHLPIYGFDMASIRITSIAQLALQTDRHLKVTVIPSVLLGKAHLRRPFPNFEVAFKKRSH